MFERPHHQQINFILESMDENFLRDTKCYFGSGTAICLLLNEFRESVDIDFLCSDQEGYRRLRSSVFDHGLNELFPDKVKTLRDIRADRDGVRAVLASEDGTPIKFEIVRESRIKLVGIDIAELPVPCLTKTDMFAEKLMANADRYVDKSIMSRDVIDIIIMESHWGKIPSLAWEKASGAYGNSVYVALRKAKEFLRDDVEYLNKCVEKMRIGKGVSDIIKDVLTHGYKPNSQELGR